MFERVVCLNLLWSSILPSMLSFKLKKAAVWLLRYVEAPIGSCPSLFEGFYDDRWNVSSILLRDIFVLFFDLLVFKSVIELSWAIYYFGIFTYLRFGYSILFFRTAWLGLILRLFMSSNYELCCFGYRSMCEFGFSIGYGIVIKLS